MKDKELFESNKNILTFTNNNDSLSKIINSNDPIKKFVPNNNPKNDSKNILQQNFFIYLKLINNCFDFTIEIDREKIKEIINLDKIIFALQNYKINLDLRTEFLRILRKFFLDIKYSENDNNLYTNIIVNNQDSLEEIKNNPLINNFEYPTKLLNFLFGFYNITAKCSIKEKIQNIYNIKNERLKKTKTFINLSKQNIHQLIILIF